MPWAAAPLEDNLEMLRIDQDSDGCVSRFHLIGRIQADRIECIRSAMSGGSARKVLDLTEITLVDAAAVRFLIDCENDGIELARCPLYVREWIARERAEAP
jgi:hypothetical protein